MSNIKRTLPYTLVNFNTNSLCFTKTQKYFKKVKNKKWNGSECPKILFLSAFPLGRFLLYSFLSSLLSLFTFEKPKLRLFFYFEKGANNIWLIVFRWFLSGSCWDRQKTMCRGPFFRYSKTSLLLNEREVEGERKCVEDLCIDTRRPHYDDILHPPTQRHMYDWRLFLLFLKKRFSELLPLSQNVIFTLMRGMKGYRNATQFVSTMIKFNLLCVKF